MFIVIGVIVVIATLLFFVYKKQTAPNISDNEVLNKKTKEIIKEFLNEIVSDYYNEYRINYLANRYNIKVLESETAYVFKTKRIGSLSSMIDYSQVDLGAKYLIRIIVEKYQVNIPINEQLAFITEVSRIEGKIKAVESVKSLLPEEDYKRLISELEDDIIYYKQKFSTSA